MNFSEKSYEEIKKAYKYCESVTKLHAKSFYFAAKFLPKIKQKAVYPIYAFCRRVDDEIDEIGAGDELQAVKLVKKWEENLKKVYEDISDFRFQIPENNEQQTANNEQNKIFLAWSDLLRIYKIPQVLPLDLIKGVLMDTTIKRYETFEELYVYCYRVASTVGLMSSEILGYSDVVALEYAEKMGVAMQLTNILRDIKEDAAIGRIYLPLEDLRKFNVTEKQILANEFDENFCELMKFQIERAENYYREGEKGIRLLEKDSRFTVLLASRTYAGILDEIKKLNYNIFLKRAHTTKLQKVLSIPKIRREAKKF